MRVAYTGRQMNMPAKMCRAFYSLFSISASITYIDRISK